MYYLLSVLPWAWILEWGKQFSIGLLHSINIAFWSILFGLILGLGLAFMKNSEEISFRLFGNIVTSIIRSVPELLTLIIVYNLGQRIINNFSSFMGLNYHINIDMFLSGVVALAMIFGAYSSEVFSGALQSLNIGNQEAAKSLGLKFWPLLRFITLPELLFLSRAGLTNLTLSLVKQTSLISVIGYPELLGQFHKAASSSGHYILLYGLAGLCYALMCWVTELILNHVFFKNYTAG